MKTPKNKTQGRHGQMNKVMRLRRRELGQWRPQPQQARGVNRFTIADAEWRSGDE